MHLSLAEGFASAQMIAACADYGRKILILLFWHCLLIPLILGCIYPLAEVWAHGVGRVVIWRLGEGLIPIAALCCLHLQDCRQFSGLVSVWQPFCRHQVEQECCRSHVCVSEWRHLLEFDDRLVGIAPCRQVQR